LILHAPLALLAALFVVTIAVAAPDDALVPQQIGLDVASDTVVTLASLSR